MYKIYNVLIVICLLAFYGEFKKTSRQSSTPEAAIYTKDLCNSKEKKGEHLNFYGNLSPASFYSATSLEDFLPKDC
jgi:hypothetical protein